MARGMEIFVSVLEVVDEDLGRHGRQGVEWFGGVLVFAGCVRGDTFWSIADGYIASSKTP